MNNKNQDKRNHASSLPVGCSALLHPKQCSFLSDGVHFVDLGVAKNSVRFSVKSKLLLNRKELERVFYMKKLRLIDIFPTAYDLNHSDQPFVKNSRKNSRCLSKSAARFSKLTKNHKESQNHFNIWKLRLVRSFPTAYNTPRFAKQFKNWSENSTKNFNFFEKQSSAI